MVNERELLKLVEEHGWNEPLLYYNISEELIEKYRKNINIWNLRYSRKLSKECILKNYTHKNDHSQSLNCFFCDCRLKYTIVFKDRVYYCPKCLL